MEIWKHDRTLHAYCVGGAEISLQIALGRGDAGPKVRAGDHRTPEGTYRVIGPARESRFHLFIPIDYPSPADADRAREEGRITPALYERIVAAHERGAPPPQDTPLGGHLGIHGEGHKWQGESERVDWTYGCIAVTDAEIEFLAERVEPGVPLTIHP